jgi:hypothetical protein
VQLVSIETEPGTTEKDALPDPAVTGPAPHPDRTASPKIGSAWNSQNREPRTLLLPGSTPVSDLFEPVCAISAILKQTRFAIAASDGTLQKQSKYPE